MATELSLVSEKSSPGGGAITSEHTPLFQEPRRIKRAGPSERPAPEELCGYLPNDPASQKPTSHQQHASTKRDRTGYRNTTCRRQPSSRSRSSTAATTATSSGCSSRSSCSLGHLRTRRSGVDVDVTTSGCALEASEHLILADTQLLGRSAEVCSIGVLVLPESGLDLVAVHVLDAASDRRLGEGRGGSCKHHRQHRR